MTVTPRRATEQDFKSGTKFCTIHLNLSSSRMEVRVSSRSSVLSKDQGGNIRLSCFGTIENIDLGQFHYMSSGGFGLSGTFIDYAENEQQLLAAATAFVDKKRHDYIAAANAMIEDFAGLSVSVSA